MTEILSKKSGPMQKILDLNDNRLILQEEIAQYQARSGVSSKAAGQDQKDLILRYVLIKSNIGDLYCQKTLLEGFTLRYIKENSDGNLLAKVYLDFITAVEFLQSLDKEMLTDCEMGREYIREFNL